VELARALERAAAADGQIGPAGLIVPNQYVLDLHPDDFAPYASSREALQRDLAAYLLQQAQRRGWNFSGWPSVDLRPSESVPRGRVHVGASRTDSQPDLAPSSPSAASIERTSVLPAREAPRASPVSPRRRAWLELEDGQQINLAGGRVCVGRGLDNDLVLDHESVSRRHAEIRRERGRLVIRDLGSTNGTRVDGRPIQERVLEPNATIHIGAVPLRLHVSG
jgi:hypothetical protein